MTDTCQTGLVGADGEVQWWDPLGTAVFLSLFSFGKLVFSCLSVILKHMCFVYLDRMLACVWGARGSHCNSENCKFSSSLFILVF